MPASVRLLLAANTGALVVVWPYWRAGVVGALRQPGPAVTHPAAAPYSGRRETPPAERGTINQ